MPGGLGVSSLLLLLLSIVAIYLERRGKSSASSGRVPVYNQNQLKMRCYNMVTFLVLTLLNGGLSAGLGVDLYVVLSSAAVHG